MSDGQAIESLLSLAGPSFKIERAGADAVRVEIFSVRSKRGRVLMPLSFNLEVEILVTLDAATRRYSFSGRSFESSGFSMHAERFTGVYRRKEWGKYLTLDGVVPVKFDTGAVFDRIEATLQPLGWRRA